MNDLRMLNKIKKSKFNEIFKLLDLIVLDFGNPIKYSLHIASDVRICKGDKIIFNVSDEFFTKEGIHKLDEGGPSDQETSNDPDSLLVENLKKVNLLLAGKTPKKIKVSKWKDLVIQFPDKIEIQIMQDCLGIDYEYYRFIEYSPHYDSDPNKYSSIHYVVYNAQGSPKMKKE